MTEKRTGAEVTEHERFIAASKRLIEQTEKELEFLRQSELSLMKHIRATRQAMRQPDDATETPPLVIEPK